MTRNKTVLTIVGLLVTAGLAAGIYSIAKDNQTSNVNDTVDYNAPTQEQKQAGDTQKESTIEGGDSSGSSSNQSQESESDSNSQPTTEVTVVLTRAQTDENLVTVAGYVENNKNGKCILTLSSNEGANQLTYTNETSFSPTNPDNVDCNTFRIQRSELKDSDVWTAQITYNAPGYKGASNVMEIRL